MTTNTSTHCKLILSHNERELKRFLKSRITNVRNENVIKLIRVHKWFNTRLIALSKL